MLNGKHIMGSMLIYKQILRLTSFFNGIEQEEQLVERTIQVRYLKRVGQKAYSYDPELKIHFENKWALGNVYELGISKVCLFPSLRLKKASGLNRRLLYLYNWIQLNVGLTGAVRSIENKEEIRNNWSKLKQIFATEYVGDVVDFYIDKIDNRLNTTHPVWDCVHQYFNFGLIFPSIPPDHNSNWKNTRLVELSEYEDEFFEEHCTFEEQRDNKRVYSLSGNTLPESKTKILSYKGEILFLGDNLLPDQCKVQVTYERGNISNRWDFELNKVEL